MVGKIPARLAVADIDLLEHGEPIKREGHSPAPPTNIWHCQAAIAVTQASFVVGSVWLKSSLQYVDEDAGEMFSPIVYALARESLAGPLLMLLAWFMAGSTWPQRGDLWRVAFMGGAMFLSQLCYILGIELSGVVVATCMQPAIPVFTAVLGITLHMEAGNPRKLAGIALAATGAVCMVMGGASAASSSSAGHSGGAGGAAAEAAAAATAASNLLLGDFCLLVNTLAMAGYYIVSKQMVQRYPAICVAAWAYVVAAACMATAAAVFTEAADWHFPRSMVLPLAYWVLVCSVLGYYSVTWAMRHLPASQVAAFQCLQPFVGTLLAFLVLGEEPTVWDLGAVGIVAGLLLVTTDRRDFESSQAVVARLKRLLSHGSLALPRSLSLMQLRQLAPVGGGSSGGSGGGSGGGGGGGGSESARKTTLN